MGFTKFFKKIADSTWFSTFIISVIVLAGVLVGIQTYKDWIARHNLGNFLHTLDQIVLWIFVVEVVVKILAEGKKPWRYFMDPWNIFDFSIVAVCFLPVDGSFIAVLRLARILRVLKLVTALPKLQLIVGALLRSIPSMGYVGLLLGLLFYIYAAMATFIYGENDPVHFGNLQISMLSLFRAVTLEDWTDLMYINMYGCDQYGYDGMMEKCTNPSASPVGAAMFFVSFIGLGALIIINLFIGVIMTGMDEMRQEAEVEELAKVRANEGKIALHDEIKLVTNRIDDLKEHLQMLDQRLKVETVTKESMNGDGKNGQPKELPKEPV